METWRDAVTAWKDAENAYLRAQIDERNIFIAVLLIEQERDTALLRRERQRPSLFAWEKMCSGTHWVINSRVFTG